MIEEYYDEVGDLEWLRLHHDAPARTSFEMHRRFLERHIRRGMVVLEIGAGPGRFTIVLAELGCEVVVSDLSAVQLQLNEQHVREAGCEDAVRARVQLDVCDLTGLADGTFDAVVAYGGPLSYLFGDEERALRECLRVTRPGGAVLASVMSLAGSARRFLAAFPPTIEVVGLDVFDQFLGHGDQRVIAGAPDVHPCQLFTWHQLEELVETSGGRVIDRSASNWLALGPSETVEYFESEPALHEAFLDWEERCCSEPGAIDGGTHILVAVAHESSTAVTRPRRGCV
jgi:SAM-dependent methyltransferase